MRINSKEYQTLLEIVKRNPEITSSEAIKTLRETLRTEDSGVEVLGLRTIASRYLNNLGFFGGV